MSSGDDWTALAAAWQAQPVNVDVEALQRAVRRRSWRMRLLMALDVVCAVAGVGLAAYLFLHVTAFWPRVGAVVGLVVLAASVLINYRLRQGLWQAADNSVTGLLKLQRRRCVNAVRMALWGPLFLPLGMLIGTLVGRGWTTPAPAMPGWSPSARLALLLAVLVLFVLASLLYVRRQRRRIAAIDMLLQQLER